ncbi:hypothetical protein Tco_0178464 [Tanacetum coccineum]
MVTKPIRIHFNRPITHAISSTDILNLQALISLTDDLSLRSNMAALESCPKHNMIANLEKTEGNVEFHEVIDFLQRSYISHALTVRHITAKVAGKLVSISEASIRTDLLFDDADGIDTLPNQAIFDAIQLMGYEGDLTVLTFNKALFSPQWSISEENIKGTKRQQRKRLSKKKKVQIESVSKQGRKNAKGDGKAKENAQSEGRTKEMMDEDKETDEVGLSTEDEVISTDDQVDASEDIFKGTEDKGEGSEERVESTTEQRVSTEEQSKEEIASQASQTSSLTPTSVIFGDDETIATLLINMSKAKVFPKKKRSVENCKELKQTRILAEKASRARKRAFLYRRKSKFLHDTIVVKESSCSTRSKSS